MRRSLLVVAVLAALAIASPVPTAVAASSPGAWSKVSAGGAHTCAIKPDATLWCWGSNTKGQVGDGTTSARTSPVQIGTSSWLSVSAGGNHTCAIRSDHTLWCWGYNAYGQLGTNSTADKPTPTKISTSTSWALVSAGGAHSCAIKTDHTLYCWGSNSSGRLGDGTSTARLTPKRITTSTSWAKVVAGAAQTCGLKSDRTLWCWGNNGSGRLGDGTTSNRYTPSQITKSTTWTSVTTSNAHTCASKSDHTLWCWGYNKYGGVGDGTTTTRLAAVRVTKTTDWYIPSVGYYHSCAVKTSHTLWCWGLGTSGQLGDGNSHTYLSPSQNSDATTWTGLSVGGSHACALQSDQSLWCWGVNSSGQIGDGSTTNSSSVNQVFSPDPGPGPDPTTAPCDANANADATALAATMDGWKTNHLMAVGQQVNISSDSWQTPLTALAAANAAHPQPKIIGFDFKELADAKTFGHDRVPDLIAKAQAGAILTASWHGNNPFSGHTSEGSWVSAGTNGDKLHLADVADPGTAAGAQFTSKWNTEVVAPLLQFQAAHVPVIVRPFHEAGQSQFWWGRYTDNADYADHTTAYKAVFARAQALTASGGAHNVLWSYAGVPKTWNGITPAVNLLPACVDIAGMDTYDPDNSAFGDDPADHVETTDYATLAAAVPRMGFTEVGPFGSNGSWNPSTVTTTLNNSGLYAAMAMFWFDDGDGSQQYEGKKQISSLTGGPAWLANCEAASGSPGMCKLNN